MTIRRHFHRPLATIIVAAASLAVSGCSRAPRTDGATANLAQAASIDPTDAPTWPTDGQWVPLTQGSAYLQDPAKDKTGDTDVVGDATHPAVYAWADANHVYWRLRVNGSPVAHAGWPEMTNSLWVCLLDTDGVANTYEWLLWVNGKTATPDTVEIWQNTTTQTFDSPSDKPETLASSLNIKNTSSAHARVVATSATSSPSSFATATKADPDYFVDAAFDRSVLSGISGSTPIRLACGTSATAQGLNADFTSLSNATTLSALFSDAMLFGDGGVSTCNSATACGPTCGACGGATPVCAPATGCHACDGDYGTAAANACPSSAPFCAADGSCGSCASNTDCTSGTATHGGAVCLAGVCQDSCSVDTDCGTGRWCSSGKCTATLANGVATTSDDAHSAGCPAIGAAECTSGVCDPADNACGWADGDGTCDPSSASTVCRSGHCGAASSTCLPTGACRLDGDCATGEACDLESYTCAPIASDPPSDPTPPSDPPSDPTPPSDPPVSGDPPSDPVSPPAPSGCVNDYSCPANTYCSDFHTCVAMAPNGELPSGNSCSRGTQCLANACGGDGICGFTAGSSCTSNEQCRSQVCDPNAQRCVQCIVDSQCGAGLACVTGGCRHRVANGELCARPQQCTSGVCGSDGMCGGVDGELCGSPDACRSGICSAGLCTAARLDAPGGNGKPVRIPPGGNVDLGSSENGASASFSSDLDGNGGDLEAGGGGGLSCSVGWSGTSHGTNVGGLLAAALAALAISRRRRAA